MYKLTKKTSFKFSAIAVLLCTVLISIVIICLSAESIKAAFSSFNDSDFNVEVNKTAQWNDETYTNGTIKITAKTQGRENFTPDVLFLGTMCAAHGLKTETVKNSLNAITNTSNVDYFMFNNNASSHTTPNTSGHLNKEQKLTEDIVIADTGNHQAMGQFIQCIYEQHNNKVTTTGKGYDFIILEFDGTRISDWYRNLKPDGDSGTINGTYNKFDHEAETVNILKDYYANNQVIWITDEDDGYNPTRQMNVRGDDYLTRKINYNTLKGLLAPDLYYPVTDTSSMTVDEITAYEKTLPDSINDDVPTDYILGDNRQSGYSESSRVDEFLSEAIHDVYVYTMIINDKVDVKDNLKITENSVQLYESETGEEGSWVPYTKGDEKITIDYNTGQVKVEVPNLEGNKFFQLHIGFKDKSATERFVYTSQDGNPNSGTANVIVDPKAGETKSDDAETEIPLDWTLDIFYKSANLEQGSVTNPIDKQIHSKDPLEKLLGSTPEAKDGFIFQFWTNSKGEVVSGEEVLFKPKQNEYGRNFTDTYTAHFVPNPETKILTVSKMWSDGNENHLNDTVKAKFFVNDGAKTYEWDLFDLNKTGEWMHSTYPVEIYSQVVNPGFKLQYWFEEAEVPEGYEVSYDTDEEGNTVITNTLKPTPEPQPVPDPINSGESGTIMIGNARINTGDIMNAFCFVVIAIVAGSVAFVIDISRRRKD